MTREVDDRDRKRLDDAIYFGEAGDFGPAIEYGWLVKWLKELRELRAEKQKAARAMHMASLVDFWGLTKDEAERVFQRSLDGKLEFEEGTCRTCKGSGTVDRFIRSRCFGSESINERCTKCGGTGTDAERIKVPEAVVETASV